MKVIGIDGITNEYEYVKMGEFLVPIAEGRLLEKIFFRVLINSKKVFFESPQAYFLLHSKSHMRRKKTEKKTKHRRWGDDSDSEEERNTTYYSLLRNNKEVIDAWKKKRSSAIRTYFEIHHRAKDAQIYPPNVGSFNVQLKN